MDVGLSEYLMFHAYRLDRAVIQALIIFSGPWFDKHFLRFLRIQRFSAPTISRRYSRQSAETGAASSRRRGSSSMWP